MSLKPTLAPSARVALYGLFFALAWTATLSGSLAWNLYRVDRTAIESAHIQARTAFEKDVLYRRWNAMQGGVYAPITPETYPNPYLDVEDRDLTTPGGKALTMVNPAYMTRQVHELGASANGVIGHLTSLKPIRAENAPDDWEKRALEILEKGSEEVSEKQIMDGTPYLRLMSPLITEESCLRCHARQGYKLGQIRGGISVSVPLNPFMDIAGRQKSVLFMTHLVLWLIGLTVLYFLARRIHRRMMERFHAETERERIIGELQDALAEVKTLKGFLPICASCKKIRNDAGYWQQVEKYIMEHSEVRFSHGICPDCARKLYPEYCKGE